MYFFLNDIGTLSINTQLIKEAGSFFFTLELHTALIKNSFLDTSALRASE